jgi:hypothetical protein
MLHVSRGACVAGCLLGAWVCAAAAGDEVDDLVRKLSVPARFAKHTPDFSVEKREFAFQGPKGPYRQTMHVIRDGDRTVALYSARPQIDLITHDPAKAPRKLVMPVRYHNATFLGTRVTTLGWVDRWGVSGDEHGFAFSGGGKTLTFREWQRWKPGGKLGRTGESVHTFTLRCDSVLGYAIDIDCRFAADKLPTGRRGEVAKGFELINMLSGRMSDVWPGRWRYDRTVYCPGPGDTFAGHRYFGWWNNCVAADRSDGGHRGEGHRRVHCRPGGFVAFLADADGWGPALVRTGDYTFELRTCNVWQDQHNIVHFPKRPDRDGFHRMNPKFLLVFLPPEVTAHVLKAAKMDDFDGARAVMVRIGVTEDFEDQPLPLTTPIRGAYGYGLRATSEAARSGTKSLLVKGTKDPKTRGGFLFLPQIPLDAGSTYQLEAFCRVVGEGTEACITGDLYEHTPHHPQRLLRQQTNSATSGGDWQRIGLTFRTERFDPYIDLRFRVVGPGRAFFDDFRLVKVGGEGAK